MKIDVKGVIVPNDDQWIYDLLEIDAVCPKRVQAMLDAAPNERAEIYINSPGGHVFSGSEIYDALRAHPGGVRLHVTGHAASAASVIMCAGPCDVSPTALVMIHNVSGGAQGDYHAMDAASGLLQKANRAISAAYQLKTGKTEAELLEMMDRETWMTAQEAVEVGFADEITKPVNPARLTAAAFGLLPEATLEALRARRAALDPAFTPKPDAQKLARAKLKLLNLGGKAL